MLNDPSNPKVKTGEYSGYSERREYKDGYIINPSWKDIDDFAKALAGKPFKHGVRYGVCVDKDGDRFSAIWDAEKMHDQFYLDYLKDTGYVLVPSLSYGDDFDLKRLGANVGLRGTTVSGIFSTISRDFTPVQLEEIKKLFGSGSNKWFG